MGGRCSVCVLTASRSKYQTSVSITKDNALWLSGSLISHIHSDHTISSESIQIIIIIIIIVIIISLHQIPSLQPQLIVFEKYFSKIQLPFNGLPGSCCNLIVRCVCEGLTSSWHQADITDVIWSSSRPPSSVHPMTQIIPDFLPNIKSQHLERVFTFVG